MMTTLQKLHAIEKVKVIYDIHYCRAGIGFLFYDPPKDYKKPEVPEAQEWRKHLTVDKYYPTFEEAVSAEYKKLLEWENKNGK